MKDKPIVKRKKEKRIIEREVVSFESASISRFAIFQNPKHLAVRAEKVASTIKGSRSNSFLSPDAIQERTPVQEFHRSIDPISIDKHSPRCQRRTFRGMLERSREISGSLLCPPSPFSLSYLFS